MGRPIKKKFFGDVAGSGQQIQCTAWVPTVDGGTSAVTGYIVKQVGSRRYKVTTAQGTGICHLADPNAAALTAGQMSVAVSPNAGGTEYARHIMERKVETFSDHSYKWVVTGVATTDVNQANLATA